MFIVKLKKLPYDAFFYAVCGGVFFIFLFLYFFEYLIELPSAVIIHTHSQKNRSLGANKAHDVSFYVFYNDDVVDAHTTQSKNVKKKEKKIVIKSDRPGLSDGDIEDLYRLYFTHKKTVSHQEEKIMLIDMPTKQKKIIPQKKKEKKNNEKKQKKRDLESVIEKKSDIKKDSVSQPAKELTIKEKKNILPKEKEKEKVVASDKKNFHAIEPVDAEKIIVGALHKNNKEITEKIFNSTSIIYRVPCEKGSRAEHSDMAIYSNIPVVTEEKDVNKKSNVLLNEVLHESNITINNNNNNNLPNDDNNHYYGSFHEADQSKNNDSIFENSSEYYDFLNRLKRGLEQFPGKKQHCFITLKIKSYAIDTVIVATKDKNSTVSSAYRAHIISLIKRLPIPYVLFENKAITIEI